jgi:HSP20 family protein
MTEERRQPLRGLVALQEEMGRRLLVERERGAGDAAAPAPWQPTADICEDREAIIVCLELPGLDQSEIDVQIEEQTLIVQGERRLEEQEGLNYPRIERSYGPFRRTFALPSNIDQTRVRASCERGLLRVVLPKRQGSGARQIEVEVRRS